MINRRMFLEATAAGLLAIPIGAPAQQRAKVIRIGLLDYSASDPVRLSWWKAFRDRLRALGYVEGQNVVFEPRWGNGQVDRLPGLVAELIDAKVEVIVTSNSEVTIAAKHATSTIPIVTAAGSDPVELGLVASLARPGGNITGVTSVQSELELMTSHLLQKSMNSHTSLASQTSSI